MSKLTIRIIKKKLCDNKQLAEISNLRKYILHTAEPR